MIRQSFIDKGVKYEDIPNIIIIYLTKDDILGKGSTVYNVSMDIVSDQKENVGNWDCGLKVLYVNTKGLTNKTINEYLSQFTDKTTYITKYITKYIETSKIKKEVFSVGGNGMTTFFKELFEEARTEGLNEGRQEGIQEGIQEGNQEGQANLIKTLIENGLITKEIAEKGLQLLNQ